MSNLISAITSAASGLIGCGVSALIVVAWVANFASCFEGKRGPESGELTPRSVDMKNPAEARLIGRLISLRSSFGTDSSRIWIVDDSVINAASLGGGRFVLWTGLARLPDEALDAIYAHEIAHDQLSHSRNITEVAEVMDFVGQIVSTFTASDLETENVIRRWSGKLVLPRYSQKQELEADARAVRILSEAGYAEDASSVICRTFVELRRKLGEAGGGFFASHPGLSERIQAIQSSRHAGFEASACK